MVRTHPLNAIAAALAIACGSCAEPDESCRVSVRQEGLTNGGPHADYLELEPREEAAVVQVGFYFAESPFEESCSGVLIAPGVVLTAKHCSHEREPVLVDVHVVVESQKFVSEAFIAGAHPELDLMVVLLNEPWSEPPGVATLPLAQALPIGFAVGQLVQVAGFGRDSEGAVGRRAFLVEQLLRVDDRELTVGADGLGGACFGDSGGPLVVRSDDGSARTLGILGSGAASCYGEDRYTRVDAVADWIAETASVDVTTPVSGPHAELGGEGRCFGETSVWVENESLQARVCGDADPCGWSARENGFRCVPAAQDPCWGIDDVGFCEDGTAMLCVRGRVVRNPCGKCGFECARSPTTGQPICLGEAS